MYIPQYSGLADDFAVNPASCDNAPHYEDYLRTSALTDMKCGRAVTFIACEMQKRRPKRILGYISLKSSALLSSDEQGMTARPALEVAELAVRNGYERQHIGTQLMQCAIDIANKLRSKALGIQYIILLADPKAVPFYESLKPKFCKINDWYTIGTEGWNKNCVGMYCKLSEQAI